MKLELTEAELFNFINKKNFHCSKGWVKISHAMLHRLVIDICNEFKVEEEKGLGDVAA